MRQTLLETDSSLPLRWVVAILTFAVAAAAGAAVARYQIGDLETKADATLTAAKSLTERVDAEQRRTDRIEQSHEYLEKKVDEIDANVKTLLERRR